MKKKKKCVCASCCIEAECAANSWCFYDSENKKCPNYKEGMKQYREFLKSEGYIK